MSDLPQLPLELLPNPRRLPNGLPQILARTVPDGLVWIRPSHSQQHHPANPDIQRDERAWQVAVMNGAKAELVIERWFERGQIDADEAQELLLAVWRREEDVGR